MTTEEIWSPNIVNQLLIGFQIRKPTPRIVMEAFYHPYFTFGDGLCPPYITFLGVGAGPPGPAASANDLLTDESSLCWIVLFPHREHAMPMNIVVLKLC